MNFDFKLWKYFVHSMQINGKSFPACTSKPMFCKCTCLSFEKLTNAAMMGLAMIVLTSSGADLAFFQGGGLTHRPRAA